MSPHSRAAQQVMSAIVTASTTNGASAWGDTRSTFRRSACTAPASSPAPGSSAAISTENSPTMYCWVMVTPDDRATRAGMILRLGWRGLWDGLEWGSRPPRASGLPVTNNASHNDVAPAFRQLSSGLLALWSEDGMRGEGEAADGPVEDTVLIELPVEDTVLIERPVEGVFAFRAQLRECRRGTTR